MVSIPLPDPKPPLPNPFDMSGKVVILTGASSGLGRRFARALSASGASVVLAARRVERLESLASELPDALAVPCDLTAPGAPSELVSATLQRWGKIDVVVNNAGISRVLSALDDDLDGFRNELEINLVAPYELARQAARHMVQAGGGSVINVGSVLGGVGGGRLKVPGYAAAKGGLHNLTRELASQWARSKVRVNTVAPGWFETEMNDQMFATDAGMRYIIDNTPMARPGVEGELDGALLFLASDASTYVTGQVIYVDGGWTAV